MRRGRDNGFLYDDEGKFIGVNLGADYVSEHEWGIRGLQGAFGIPAGDDTKLGLEKRTVTTEASPDLILVATKKHAVLHFTQSGRPASFDSMRVESIKRDTKNGELMLYGAHTLATAWDADSFGIHTIDPKQMKELSELYDAFQRKDAAIWVGGNGGNPFARGGLVLVIVSRVPANNTEQMRAADEDRAKLLIAAAGVEEELRAAGKKWFALSPRWARLDEQKDITAYQVMFWLNPRDDGKHNYGWFTVEQLRDWIENKGPVMKEEKQAAKNR